MPSPMTFLQPPAAGPAGFSCRQVPADGSTAAWVREEFGRWLRRSAKLGESRWCDVVLAVNEALANSAEFAYLHDPPVQAGRAGTVDVEAVLRESVLDVTIADQGRWRPSDPACRQRSRGRGIPLMRTLADEVDIDTSPTGTRVRLRFDDVGGCGDAREQRDTDVLV